MKPTSLPNVEQARFNMIEQQIRPWDVNDEAVLQAIATVQRERFVPVEFRAMAFSDLEVPLIIHGVDTMQTMLAPKLEARLAQALSLKPTDCVLEIGTGSGYQAAILATMTRQVTSIEIDPRLVAFAQENLTQSSVEGVAIETGDASQGWGTTEYDAILVTGSIPSIPDPMKYQLRVGGRLVAVVGQAPAMTVVRITRITAASFEMETLFETVIKPLTGPKVSRFKF
ncbi:protein-L-isoaspartate O-methyltransferase family protein [Orrella marina]|uniref:Protein-L-isoaspartate O-methyltransferase n=1 Tax=Orrella marina TaxID=2163011 RepID=A0A2R4XL36_9BURK|nr:protein-L-isoaspartate O-methyltransferase [Orrella marina]AWB34481.1 protein-L-isoaspartate O-methyltransferase [Orrella marina]